MTWERHHSLKLFTFVMLVLPTIQIVRWDGGRPILYVSFGLVLLFIQFVSFLLLPCHLIYFCEICARKLPAEPQEVTKRTQAFFDDHHRYAAMSRPLTFLYLANTVTLVLLQDFSSSIWSHVVAVFYLVVVFIPMTHAKLVHAKKEPWCKRCNSTPAPGLQGENPQSG